MGEVLQSLVGALLVLLVGILNAHSGGFDLVDDLIGLDLDIVVVGRALLRFSLSSLFCLESFLVGNGMEIFVFLLIRRSRLLSLGLALLDLCLFAYS